MGLFEGLQNEGQKSNETVFFEILSVLVHSLGLTLSALKELYIPMSGCIAAAPQHKGK